jgi:hypothetical protein
VADDREARLPEDDEQLRQGGRAEDDVEAHKVGQLGEDDDGGDDVEAHQIRQGG